MSTVGEAAARLRELSRKETRRPFFSQKLTFKWIIRVIILTRKKIHTETGQKPKKNKASRIRGIRSFKWIKKIAYGLSVNIGDKQLCRCYITFSVFRFFLRESNLFRVRLICFPVFFFRSGVRIKTKEGEYQMGNVTRIGLGKLYVKPRGRQSEKNLPTTKASYIL